MAAYTLTSPLGESSLAHGERRANAHSCSRSCATINYFLHNIMARRRWRRQWWQHTLYSPFFVSCHFCRFFNLENKCAHVHAAQWLWLAHARTHFDGKIHKIYFLNRRRFLFFAYAVCCCRLLENINCKKSTVEKSQSARTNNLFRNVKKKRIYCSSHFIVRATAPSSCAPIYYFISFDVLFFFLVVVVLSVDALQTKKSS